MVANTSSLSVEQQIFATHTELQIGDLLLECTPLTLRQEVQLDDYVRAQHLRNVEGLLATDKFSEAMQEACIEAAIRSSFLMHLGSDEGIHFYSTAPGMARMVYLMCDGSHPIDELLEAIASDEDSASSMQQIFMRQNPHLFGSGQDAED